MSNSFKSSSLLTVSGAKFNRKSFDEGKGNNLTPALGLIGTSNIGGNNGTIGTLRSDQMTSELLTKGLYSSNSSNDLYGKSGSATNASSYGGDGTPSNTNNNINSNNNSSSNNGPPETKYWRYPSGKKDGVASSLVDSNSKEDMVVIHVCDENQQVSKDFCCRRDILVQHMRYFQKFLNETENGYDDIDISVHCDVEIFEWLMNYIHDTTNPPKMDKSILISILISSEFLQMDPLVELCVTQVSNSLNDIIKLPIDLSCISEKLINRIASITSPKALSEIKDRKDKILTKLYKRRVELDFSRKGSASKGSSSSSAPRTIAASLTCCRYCGWVYLENYSAFLTCRNSPPSIDHRGRLASRHSAIQGWSLTTYLKTLHSGGMGWDSIYWHVWAACIVLRVEDIMISALETDRYGVEPDGLLIKCMVNNSELDGSSSGTGHNTTTTTAWSAYKSSVRTINTGSGTANSTKVLDYSLDMDMDSILSGTVLKNSSSAASANSDNSHLVPTLKLFTSSGNYSGNHSGNSINAGFMFPTSIPGITTTLNPHRPPEILTSDIYELICSQMKYITGLQHKALIASTMQSMIASAIKQDMTSASGNNSSSNNGNGAASSNNTSASTNNYKGSGMSEVFYELQTLDDDDTRLYYNGIGLSNNGSNGNGGTSNNNNGSNNLDFANGNYNDEKRRGRSPARGLARLYSVSQEPRSKSSNTNGSNTASNGASSARVRSSTVGPALPSQSTSTAAANNTQNNGIAAAATGGGAASGHSSDNDAIDTPYDSDADNAPNSGSGNNGSNHATANSANGNAANGSSGAGSGRAKGTTRYHSHELQRQQQRARSLSSSTGKRNSVVAGTLNTANKNAAGLPPKAGRNGKLPANTFLMADADELLSNLTSDDQSYNTQDANSDQDMIIMARLHRILKSMPPDLYHRAQHHQKGALYGVWLQPCALTWQPPALEEMLCVVEDSHLPEHKKLEWQLDLMREYDEKRMDKLERWLASKRNPAYDIALNSASNNANKSGNNPNIVKTLSSKARFGTNGQYYYKERMRLPYKCVI